MSFEPANHYVISGSGVSAVADVAPQSGRPSVSLEVDGQKIVEPKITVTFEGFVVQGTIETVPDSHTLVIRLVFPQVNLSEPAVTFSGFAVLVREFTSVGGPRLVSGPLQTYELRPVGGTASGVLS